MNMLDGLTQRKWVLPGIAIVIGIALGVAYAWVVNPVRWVEGTPEQLRADLQQDYLRMAIDSYSINRDVDLAIERYQSLGSHAQVTLEEIGANPGQARPTDIQNFRAVVEIFKPSVESQTTNVPGGGIGGASRFLLPVCGGTILLGILLGAVLFFRDRVRLRGAPTLSEEEAQARMSLGSGPIPQPRQAAPAADTSQEPLATFRTIYALGDDLYDDSFSIESATGDFLGECGVGIGDVIGVGDPKKVSALEVWLFDKNDIQTVTKVLMSRYAFQDDATHNRLAAKGDPALAESGGVIYLQTASLEVEARVVDLVYGEGALPRESFFERATLELRAWSRGS
ncbi:MAG TPA: hypothetical protein VJK02_21625 [Anaerolineales bacterium]|nr:hypothetical protein [Anaerolineales bacterium]